MFARLAHCMFHVNWLFRLATVPLSTFNSVQCELFWSPCRCCYLVRCLYHHECSEREWDMPINFWVKYLNRSHCNMLLLHSVSPFPVYDVPLSCVYMFIECAWTCRLCVCIGSKMHFIHSHTFTHTHTTLHRMHTENPADLETRCIEIQWKLIHGNHPIRYPKHIVYKTSIFNLSAGLCKQQPTKNVTLYGIKSFGMHMPDLRALYVAAQRRNRRCEFVLWNVKGKIYTRWLVRFFFMLDAS